MREVTFRDFQKLMSKRRRTVNDLVDIFRGKLEDSRSFFERVMACQWRNPETGRYEDRSDVMIPYQSVIEYYLKELIYLKDSLKGRKQRKIGGLASLISLRNFEPFSPCGYLPP
jgi:hypothetical protein